MFVFGCHVYPSKHGSHTRTSIHTSCLTANKLNLCRLQDKPVVKTSKSSSSESSESEVEAKPSVAKVTVEEGSRDIGNHTAMGAPDKI